MPLQHTPRPSSRAPRFPNRIREYRLKAGLTQRQLAARLGLGRHMVSAWERGRTFPIGWNLFKMATELGTMSDALYADLRHAKTPEVTTQTIPAQS